MQKIDSKIINSIPSDELINLWNSGLGQKFCEKNKNDLDVLSIKNNISFYREKGKKIFHSSFSYFFVSILIFLLTYLIISYVNISMAWFLAIVSGVVSFGFLLSGAMKILKSREFHESANKLSNYDLSGFDIEDYVPSQKRLMRKSIEWGFTEGKLAIENDKIKWIKTSDLPIDEHKI